MFFAIGKTPTYSARIHPRFRRQQMTPNANPPRRKRVKAPGSGTVENCTVSNGAPAEPLSREPNRRTVARALSDSLRRAQPKLLAPFAYQDCTSLSRFASLKL